MFQSLVHVKEPRNQSISWFDLQSVQYAYHLTPDFSKYPTIGKGLWNGNAWGIRKELYDKLDYILDICIAGCCDCAYNVAAFGKKVDWYLPSFPEYSKYFWPWIEKGWEVFKQGSKALKGRMLHFNHPILFNWDSYLKQLGGRDYNLDVNLVRDKDYLLAIKPNSPLEHVFRKQK